MYLHEYPHTVSPSSAQVKLALYDQAYNLIRQMVQLSSEKITLSTRLSVYLFRLQLLTQLELSAGSFERCGQLFWKSHGNELWTSVGDNPWQKILLVPTRAYDRQYHISGWGWTISRSLEDGGLNSAWRGKRIWTRTEGLLGRLVKGFYQALQNICHCTQMQGCHEPCSHWFLPFAVVSAFWLHIWAFHKVPEV